MGQGSFKMCMFSEHLLCVPSPGSSEEAEEAKTAGGLAISRLIDRNIHNKGYPYKNKVHRGHSERII